MNNNNTNWNIINITGNRVLDAHDLLTSNDIPCLAFVEIVADPKVKQAQKRGKAPLVAQSAYTQLLFADLSLLESKMTLAYLSGRKSYIHQAWGRQEANQGQSVDTWLYSIKDHEFDGIRSIINETGRRKNKAHWETYNRESHSRFNLNKLRGQGEAVPHFTVGQQVEFIAGGYRGLIFEVDKVDADGQIHLESETPIFGSLTAMKVENPYMLKEVA